MTLKKLTLRSGINRENTRYTNENGWYEGDKVRFRQGTPEKIGGWARISTNKFLGVCRSLFGWVTLLGQKLVAVATNTKYYIEFGGVYNDITPLRDTVILTDPFATVITSDTVTVTSVAHGALVGDFVTFSGASAVGGLTLNGEFAVTTVIDTDSYTIMASTVATSTATGGGTVTAEYQINIGLNIASPVYGWSAGAWGSGDWGVGVSIISNARIWSQSNFGQNLIFGYQGGPMYYWVATADLSNRGVPLTSLLGASDVPTIQNFIIVSDVARTVIAFGCNDYGSSVQDPLLIRWSDRESVVDWTPSIASLAGSLRLSHGSRVVTALQARQEILVWTDASIYSLQFLGLPDGWGATLVGDNTSIISGNAVAYASGVVYWMGIDKFYKYDGKVGTLNCDLRNHIFSDINQDQAVQVFSGTNEGFSEVWWFYCSAGATSPNKYVIYNYLENVWYYGTMDRTAWLDSGILDYPIAATADNIVYHEYGVNDDSGDSTLPINAYIESAEFDIDDGDHFGFVYRMLPDVTFRGSTIENPQLTMTLTPLKNSGSGYNNSIGGGESATVTRTATVPIEQFTGQVFVRVRGRQMILRLESNQLGTTWQCGSPRIGIRQDGRR